jgi:hypothetical protein
LTAVPARVRKLLLVLLLITAVSDQWAIMQSAAWATMLVNSLRSNSLPQAVTRTFDGQHPCALCNAIAQGKKSEKKTDSMPALTRLEFLPAEGKSSLVPADRFQLALLISDKLSQELATPPLTPPPRA